MVEKQIDVEVFVTDDNGILPAHECEALAEFEQEPFDVLKQAGLQLALVEWFRQRQEVEDIRIFERLHDQV